MTALQVDVTSMVLTGLRAQLGVGPRFVTETPADLEQAAASGVGRVIRSGGGDDGVSLDTATITIDCFSTDAPTSRGFAYDVIGAMYALHGQVVNGATFSFIRKISGPTPLPYENSAVRRQALLFRVAVKID